MRTLTGRIEDERRPLPVGERQRSDPGARRARFFPRGEIDPEQLLERLDFGQVARAQALLLFRREPAERLATAVAEIPYAAAVQKIYRAVCLAALEPVHQAGRAARESRVFRRAIEGMDVVHKIEKTKTDAGDRPIVPVKMNKVTVSGV